jgi:hypothetical protein
MRRLLLAALLTIVVPLCALAQVPVQQTATHLDAAQGYATANTTAAVITLTPQIGSIYISNIHISNCVGGTAVTAANPTSITSTNLAGLTYQMGSGVTAGTCTQEVSDNFGPGGFKALAPGAVTITLPTFATNQTIRVGVSYWSAP